jgi:hypothetical protein
MHPLPYPSWVDSFSFTIPKTILLGCVHPLGPGRVCDSTIPQTNASVNNF